MQKIGKVLGIIFLGLILLLGIPGYYFIKNFDLNKYKSYASQIVEEQLGRSFRINGEASIGISLVPTLILEDVTLANASWATEPQMLKVKKLELKFALIPLLKKKIAVDKIILINPEIYLEEAADGAKNWDFPKLNNKTAYKSSGWLIKSAYAAENNKVKFLEDFAVKSVVIKNGIIQYNNVKNADKISLDINKINLSSPSIDEQINLDADLFYNGQEVRFNAVLGSLQSLINNTAPYPILLKGNALGVALDVNGSLVNIFDDIQYGAEVNVYNPAGNLEAPEITLETRIDGNFQEFSADIRSLSLSKNVIRGKANVDVSGKVPQIKAELNSDLLDLTLFEAESSPTALTFEFVKSAQAADYVPNTQIPYDVLQKAGGMLDIKIGKLVIARGMEADNLSLKAGVNNGVLTVNPFHLSFGGGEFDASIIIDANNQDINIEAVSKDILLQNLHKEFAISSKNDFGVLSGGSTNLYLNLHGSGVTYRQLVQNLKGQAIVVVNKSEIQTGALSFMSNNFISEILNVLNLKKVKVNKIDLNCAVVRADFANGRATFPKGIAVSSQQLSFVSDGYVNMKNDKLDFSLQPFSGKLFDTNIAQTLSSFIKIKGTVQQPQIAIDDKQALGAIVGIAATGGTAYLGSKLVMEPDASPCYTALIGTPYVSMFPKPTGVLATTKDVYNGAKEDIKNSVKALKNTAKGLIGAIIGKGSM